MIAADVVYALFPSPMPFIRSLASEEIQYSIWLSMVSCTISMILSLWVSIPIGYLFARFNFYGKNLIDAIIDIPIVLPPLVIGLSLLILMMTPFGKALDSQITIVYAIPGVILAQFMVACAFSVRIMRATFEQINPRQEQVALTLGCSRNQAFWLVVLPEAQRGMITAATIAWARSLGEFGPILIFAGATRMRTEVLATTVFLEMSVGNLEAALGVSILMIVFAIIALLTVRYFGARAV
jgi:molybdate transport system permease protein